MPHGPREPISDYRGPLLTNTKDTMCWRERIRNEEHTADHLKDMLHTNKVIRARIVERPEVPIPMPPCALSLALAKLGTGHARERAAREHMRRTGDWSSSAHPTWLKMSAMAPKPRVEPPQFSAPGSMRG